MNNENLIIISFDGLSSLDFNYIKKLSNFKKILLESSYCKNVKTIYPSLTYPAHTTIVTGKYPINHEVINNTLFQLNRQSPDWYWQRKYIKSNTIYDLAIEKGLKVASLFWPVSAKSKIQYNMPEIFSNRFWQNQILVSALNGSLFYQIELNKKFGYLRKGLEEPYLGDFLQKSVLHTIKKYKPNILMAHYLDIDINRHEHGFYSKEAYDALNRHNEKLGEIIQTLKDENLYENTTIVILGDHSSKDVENVIYINSLFYKKGLIEIKNNKIKNYKAISKSCDGSTYIYIKDKKVLKDVEKILYALEKDKESGIEKVFNKKDMQKLKANNNCDFILEAREGYYFKDEISNKYILSLEDINEKDKDKYIKNSHGYHPDKKDYNTVFIIKSASVKKDNEIENMNLVDIAPTISKIMNLKLKDYDGKVLNEIFIK